MEVGGQFHTLPALIHRKEKMLHTGEEAK